MQEAYVAPRVAEHVGEEDVDVGQEERGTAVVEKSKIFAETMEEKHLADYNNDRTLILQIFSSYFGMFKKHLVIESLILLVDITY